MEHVVEVTAKRLEETAFFGHFFSHTGIHTKNGIVWTAARHRENPDELLAVGFT